MDKADLTVIGGGPGGYAAAIRGAQAGASVVLVEKDVPGGTCLNRGCIPTKSLVSSVGKMRSALGGLSGGILEGTVRPNFGNMMAEKNKAVESLRLGLATLLKKNRVSLVKASATVTKPGQVRLTMPTGEEDYLETKNIILATGSVSVLPPVAGMDLPGVMDSEKILNLTALPDKLLIIGGGVIGLEFAGIFSGLGCRVTVVEMLPALVQSMDADMSRRLLPRGGGFSENQGAGRAKGRPKTFGGPDLRKGGNRHHQRRGCGSGGRRADSRHRGHRH
jgi:dihydrolipoamide dehydrogenase